LAAKRSLADRIQAKGAKIMGFAIKFVELLLKE